jgi:putative membrane protein
MKESKSIFPSFFILIKGILMGSADIIPGISGGTIALIVGIYEQFINALQSINLSFVFYFLKGFVDRKAFSTSKERLLSIDFAFLIPLLIGVLIAFFSLANIISYSLDVYPTYTFSFFFGLILSSSVYVYFSHRYLFKPKWYLFFIFLGFIGTYLLVGVDAVQLEHSLFLLFFTGMISFCAMILPGISGAFILLLFGQYEFMLDVLRNLSQFKFEYLPYAFFFGIGGLVGLIGFSKILKFLLNKYHMQTLAFVIGLMIGALRKPGEYILQNPENNIITISMALLGVIIVFIFSYLDFSIKHKIPKKI